MYDSSQGRKIFIIRDLSEISYGHFAESIAQATRDANELMTAWQFAGACAVNQKQNCQRAKLVSETSTGERN